ncbi:MAG: PIN-like domain-containing protein [Snowella sp.]|nr:PIN-like domain-containing protein [Snowella sp.]
MESFLKKCIFGVIHGKFLYNPQLDYLLDPALPVSKEVDFMENCQMQNLFCGYYRPDENKFREIWQTATFVLDANILLNMYRYPEEARKQLLNVLQSIEARLWVPYQAALEFQRNRVAVIAEQKKRFSDVRKVLENSRKTMRSDLENLQLKKRHSSIQPDELITSIDRQISDFLSKIERT